ncbi:MAG: hypothetical protein R3E95_10345 [Thiolinea sp.]
MNRYFAFVKEINQDLEEEVTICVNNIEITCFASICPYNIQPRKEYPVSLELTVFDEYQIQEYKDKRKGLERVEDGFSYWLKGKLKNGVIDCGIQFEDEILLTDYVYLDGKFIKLKADRIDLEFL